MVRFDLFSDLLSSIHQLLDVGFSKQNIREVRNMFDYAFDRFEENEDAEIPDMEMLHGIVNKTLARSCQMYEYFQVITDFTKDIYPSKKHIRKKKKKLPTPFKQQTARDVQFVLGILFILDELLAVGVNSCNAHVARLKLDALFDCYEQEGRTPEEIEEDKMIEDFLSELDDYIEEERKMHPEPFTDDDEGEEATIAEFQ